MSNKARGRGSDAGVAMSTEHAQQEVECRLASKDWQISTYIYRSDDDPKPDIWWNIYDLNLLKFLYTE